MKINYEFFYGKGRETKDLLFTQVLPFLTASDRMKILLLNKRSFSAGISFQARERLMAQKLSIEK